MAQQYSIVDDRFVIATEISTVKTAELAPWLLQHWRDIVQTEQRRGCD